VLTDCVISDNIGCHGAGALIQNATALLRRCRFDANTTMVFENTDGGGVVVDLFADATFVQCEFSGNMASRYAGALGVYRTASAELVNCIFRGNYAAQDGSAIHVWRQWKEAGEPYFSATGCAIHGNTGGGGAVALKTAMPILKNATIAGNTATGTFPEVTGGVSIADSDAYLFNCILWGNSSNQSDGQGDQIYLSLSGTAVP
jgi:hypothetical protein